MEDNVEEPAGMGVPSSTAVEAYPDEVAESGIGGGGIVESAVLAHLVLVSKTGRVACLAVPLPVTLEQLKSMAISPVGTMPLLL